jgi:hypothetical protein
MEMLDLIMDMQIHQLSTIIGRQKVLMMLMAEATALGYSVSEKVPPAKPKDVVQ